MNLTGREFQIFGPWQRIVNFFFQICSAMMYAMVIGCSGAIAMSLTVRKKQVEKQWRQQVVVITVHELTK